MVTRVWNEVTPHFQRSRSSVRCTFHLNRSVFTEGKGREGEGRGLVTLLRESREMLHYGHFMDCCTGSSH